MFPATRAVVAGLPVPRRPTLPLPLFSPYRVLSSGDGFNIKRLEPWMARCVHLTTVVRE